MTPFDLILGCQRLRLLLDLSHGSLSCSHQAYQRLWRFEIVTAFFDLQFRCFANMIERCCFSWKSIQSLFSQRQWSDFPLNELWRRRYRLKVLVIWSSSTLLSHFCFILSLRVLQFVQMLGAYHRVSLVNI